MNNVEFNEEKQRKLKGLSKAVYIIARICKIILWIALVALIVVMCILPFALKEIKIVDNHIVINNVNEKIKLFDEDNGSIKEEYKVKIQDFFDNNSMSKIIIVTELGLVFSIVTLYIYTKIVKKVELLFMNIHNKNTPFTIENVEYLRKIAFYTILIILISLVTSILFGLILGMEISLHFDLSTIIKILIIYVIAYIFEYGYILQSKSEQKIYNEAL